MTNDLNLNTKKIINLIESAAEAKKWMEFNMIEGELDYHLKECKNINRDCIYCCLKESLNDIQVIEDENKACN